MSYKIDSKACVSCGVCVPTCPVEAIAQSGDTYVIDSKCVDCGVCVPSCPVNAISN
ncbi:MAG: 4Fe-4S binding protein [Elusimicrobia bacterium]|nr:4Fe-4S binding protein [Elusimicrobiota bacterium]